MSPEGLLHTCVGEVPSRAAPFSLPAGARSEGRAYTPWAGMYKLLFNERLVTVLRPSLLECIP